jgi:hypothetical protein
MASRKVLPGRSFSASQPFLCRREYSSCRERVQHPHRSTTCKGLASSFSLKHRRTFILRALSPVVSLRQGSSSASLKARCRMQNPAYSWHAHLEQRHMHCSQSSLVTPGNAGAGEPSCTYGLRALTLTVV